jgi:hypothetical protein
MGTGGLCTRGIVAGRVMVGGRRSWTGCGRGATVTRAGSGRPGWTRPWSARISTLREHAMSRRRTSRRNGWRRCWGPALSANRQRCRHRRSCRIRWMTQGAGPDDTNPAAGPRVQPDREGLGRPRGGLSTKIHPLADFQCRPLAQGTTAGQRHDSAAFEPLMGRLRIRRPGRGPGPTGCWRTRRTRTARSALTRGDARSRRRFRRRATSARPARPRAPAVEGPMRSTPRPARTATPSNAPSTSSKASGRWPCAPTSASSSSAALSTWPRSRSGLRNPTKQDL